MRTLLIGFALLLASACSSNSSQPGADQVFEILRAADQIEIYALHPYPHSVEEDGLADAPIFRDHASLGQATLTSSSQIQAVADLIQQGVDDSEMMTAACFNPRHGVHAESNGDALDLVICFECLSMRVYINGERSGLRTTSEPEAQLTKIWAAAGLTIHGQ